MRVIGVLVGILTLALVRKAKEVGIYIFLMVRYSPIYDDCTNEEVKLLQSADVLLNYERQPVLIISYFVRLVKEASKEAGLIPFPVHYVLLVFGITR